MINVLFMYLFFYIVIPFFDGLCGKEIKELLVYIYKLIVPLRIRFEIDFFITKIVLKKCDNIFAYPLLVSFEFEKKKYWDKFKKYKSMKEIVLIETNKKCKSVNRHFNRVPSNEAIDRLERIQELRSNAKEIYELYGERI